MTETNPCPDLDPRNNDLRYTRRRYFVDRFLLRLSQLAPLGGLLLDVGGHKIRKRGQFNYTGTNFKVIYTDISLEKSPDVQADAVMLPFLQEAFDVVVCAEVLEHVYKPEAVLREIYRVLRPHGMLLVTVPFLMQMHAHPDDYGRYTDSFWNRLLGEIGFTEIDMESHGSFWIVLIEMLTANFLRNADAGRYNRLLCLVLRSLLVLARKKALHNYTHCHARVIPAFTTGFGISCIKPAVNTLGATSE